VLRPLGSGLPGSEGLLHRVEEVRRDERLVVAVEDLPLVADAARVDRVAKEHVECARADRNARAGAHAPCVELISEVFEGDIALGVALEGEADVRSGSGVHDERAGVLVVQVAGGGLVRPAALGDLLVHALLDLFAQVPEVELGDRQVHVS